MMTGQVEWLHEERELSLAELCELSGLSEAELRALVDCGAIRPTDSDARDWTFGADASSSRAALFACGATSNSTPGTRARGRAARAGARPRGAAARAAGADPGDA